MDASLRSTDAGAALSLDRGPVPGAFAVAWPMLRANLMAETSAGVSIAAVGADGRTHGPWRLPAGPAPAIAVVGRHRRCAVRVVDDPMLAARHAAIVVEPRLGHEDVRYRVVDLGSSAGLVVEDAATARAVIADGAARVRVGGTTLVIVPSRGDEPWPVDAAAAWQALPEPAWVGSEPTPTPGRRFAHGTDAPGPRVTTLRLATEVVRRGIGAPAAPLWGGVRGWLQIAGAPAIAVDDHASTGLLLGRGEGRALPALATAGISRVHLLVVELAGELWALDCASSHGTRDGAGMPGAVFPLSREPRLTLGEGLARLAWLPRST